MSMVETSLIAMVEGGGRRRQFRSKIQAYCLCMEEPGDTISMSLIGISQVPRCWRRAAWLAVGWIGWMAGWLGSGRNVMEQVGGTST